ncbi:hypothetical protein IV102_06130 [bacterium]|nr:hypothetical protein [bacterium]
MLRLSNYQPHFASFAEAQRRFHEGDLDEPDFQLHARSFRTFLQQFQQRLNWELPLLEGFSESKAPVQLLVDPLQGLTEMVKAYPEQEIVRINLHNCERLLQRVDWFFQQLPVMVDVPIVNELLILASAEGDINPTPVQQRLPLLMEWVADLEEGWKTFLLLNPHRRSLVDKALFTVQALKGAAGGLYLYLEGQDPQGLRNGLKLMVNALEALAPLQETRTLEEMQQSTFSPDLCLERGFQLLRRLGSLPPKYPSELRKWTDEKSGLMSQLNSYLWVSNTDCPQAAQLAQELHELLGNVSNILALDQSSCLQKLEQWRRDFEALDQEFRSQPLDAPRG